MPSITFIEFDGTPHRVEGTCGKSLMLAAVENGVPGIDADCGGACACGTCHVFVDEHWRAATGQASPHEQGMLDMRPDQADNSRLSCQITVSEALDGLVVRLPEFQM
ncbi:2Fe-2S iron-sulfur cluster-binding protein [Pseudomonas sp. N040]|uniref:2Fe-2S iron-sulfur cluster-binding protein n=1 Tax=Pseudomonas sp. N040 TaxID=2785325 RepID=UPI0018A2B1A9|nr:2Fe-2S iron-sulfur cluster-binding protein [Pseudomonas sp. N040]MBF7729155.1 2Fe-2S iron-sulfur cluster binding domain-containing protein [Pseudomonas sp. N040]MBW7012795.1 2Fe-2S iron-sulfur cluster binding domain-containing protein [Pseudomonas sp. N040]